MECNKEEASRAKAIAERKLQDKDFAGARKFALKAQQLYPETENISQMICVCDVHCSAENKLFGNESDWYGILQIEQTADDTLIKKQYRKFALALHPDKNKFSGAESAFKLIGEAQKVLLDRDKRSLYDMKRRTTLKPVMPSHTSQQTSKGFNGTKISRVQSNFMSNFNSNAKGSNGPMQEPKQQAQSGASNGKETFWTQCPSCLVRYQYYKEVLHRALRCQNCSKPFFAHDMHGHATQPGPNATQPVFPQNDAQNTSTSKAGSEAVNQKPASNSMSRSEQNKEFSPETKQSDKRSNNVQGEWEEGSQASWKANGKRGKKKVVESSESFESDSSLEEIISDGDAPKAQQFGSVGDSHTRQSSRNKRNVSYNENANDDDTKPSKRAKGCESSTPLTENKADASGNGQSSDSSKLFGTASASVNEGRKGAFKSSDAGETVAESIKKSFVAENGCASNSSPETTPEPTFHEYPDPEFCDFDKGREERCFKLGQVWAAYDTVDAMPRFYARIKKVCSPGFRLEITWLEPDADDEDGIKWAESELPFSCGKFKFGDSEYTEDRLMFSHEVCWDKGSGRYSIKIYPKKGETWALFKNWDAKWYEIPENERKFEYEYVEVISEYDETVGIRVAHLGKIKGFACLFCRVGGNELQIPPADVLRFAHRVPSYRMTGDERKDVPKGSFELDPASITTRLEEISLSKLDQMNCVNDSSSKFAEANPSVKTAEKSSSSCHNDEEDNQMVHVNHSDVDVNSEELPDPEFCNFDGLKSVDKFKVNQVWALYSDIDGLPNYYGLVKKIESHPSFKLHIAWLEACHLPTDMISWKDEDMPISCGLFKVQGGNVQKYTKNSSFSHQISVDQTTRKNVFTIYPRVGEIWGTYKNWHPEMTSLSLIDCEYDIVEVLEENSSYIKVSVLERVHGFTSVFKPKMNGNSRFTREIPRIESLRFSHQIPSFKLTKERDGSLRGYWELDPAALPSYLVQKLK